MAKRTSLREFQESLASRLASAKRGEAGTSLLGVESGGGYWLLDLPDSGEVVPLPPLWPVPLTQSWFAGVANVRGTLFSVVDFSAFGGGEATPKNADARLLLVGTRHNINSALLVGRTLGLRNLEGIDFEPAAEAAPAWIGASCTDAEGRRWTRLNLKALLETPTFLDVGI